MKRRSGRICTGLISLAVILTIPLLSLPPAALAEYHFTPMPGTLSWYPTGINDSGDIVGGYFDATGEHGFLYTPGIFTTIYYPGAMLTWVSGINDSGSIVGYYDDATGDHGFLYARGKFTPIDYPGAHQTVTTGINDSGSIVGYYHESAYVSQGFVATLVAEPRHHRH